MQATERDDLCPNKLKIYNKKRELSTEQAVKLIDFSLIYITLFFSFMHDGVAEDVCFKEEFSQENQALQIHIR